MVVFVLEYLKYLLIVGIGKGVNVGFELYEN